MPVQIVMPCGIHVYQKEAGGLHLTSLDKFLSNSSCRKINIAAALHQLLLIVR